MEIKGYKALNKNMTNRYGMKMEIGKTYHANGSILFGIHGNGFHFCLQLEDTLRYVDAMNDEIVIVQVIGSGEIDEYFDDYYAYYDMYAASQLQIVKVLSREEIINPYLICSDTNRIKRFISGFRLQEEEIKRLEQVHRNKIDILQTICYYQKGMLDVYNPYIEKNTKIYSKKMV